MAKPWAGITAGLLAGAAGATAKNAVSFVDQSILGDSPASSPTGPTVTETAAHAAGGAGQRVDATRAAALGPLGGLAIGVGVGAVAGLARGANATPPPVVAAVVTGLVAMGIGDGIAGKATDASSVWSSPKNVVRDLISHLAYGAVTGYALHRMLDPRTPTVSRLRSLAS